MHFPLPLTLRVVDGQSISCSSVDRAGRTMRAFYDGPAGAAGSRGLGDNLADADRSDAAGEAVIDPTPAAVGSERAAGSAPQAAAPPPGAAANATIGLIKLLVEVVVPPSGSASPAAANAPGVLHSTRFFLVDVDGCGAPLSHLALGDVIRIVPPAAPTGVAATAALTPTFLNTATGFLAPRRHILCPPPPFQAVLASRDWLRVARGASPSSNAPRNTASFGRGAGVASAEILIDDDDATSALRVKAEAGKAAAAAAGAPVVYMHVVHASQLERLSPAPAMAADPEQAAAARRYQQWHERRWRALDQTFSGRARPATLPAPGPVAATAPPVGPPPFHALSQANPSRSAALAAVGGGNFQDSNGFVIAAGARRARSPGRTGGPTAFVPTAATAPPAPLVPVATRAEAPANGMAEHAPPPRTSPATAVGVMPPALLTPAAPIVVGEQGGGGTPSLRFPPGAIRLRGLAGPLYAAPSTSGVWRFRLPVRVVAPPPLFSGGPSGDVTLDMDHRWLLAQLRLPSDPPFFSSATPEAPAHPLDPHRFQISIFPSLQAAAATGAGVSSTPLPDLWEQRLAQLQSRLRALATVASGAGGVEMEALVSDTAATTAGTSYTLMPKI